MPAGHATTQPYPAKRFAAELSRKAIEEQRVTEPTVMEKRIFRRLLYKVDGNKRHLIRGICFIFYLKLPHNCHHIRVV